MTSRHLHLLALAAFLIAPTLGAQDSSIVIRAGRVLDGRGGTLATTTIVVRGGPIATVSPA